MSRSAGAKRFRVQDSLGLFLCRAQTAKAKVMSVEPEQRVFCLVLNSLSQEQQLLEP